MLSCRQDESLPGGGVASHDWPVQRLKVSAIQKVGQSARTRKTTWVPRLARIGGVEGAGEAEEAADPGSSLRRGGVDGLAALGPPPTSEAAWLRGRSSAMDEGRMKLESVWGAGSPATTSTATATAQSVADDRRHRPDS